MQSYVVRPPVAFVESAMALVTKQDFFEVSHSRLPPKLRLPNPRIEGQHWVTVRVNAFNSSNGEDPAIARLYGAF